MGAFRLVEAPRPLVPVAVEAAVVALGEVIAVELREVGVDLDARLFESRVDLHGIVREHIARAPAHAMAEISRDADERHFLVRLERQG